MTRRSEKKIHTFFLQFPLTHYQKQQIVLGGGQKFSGIMYIVSGYIRQYIITSEGVEQTTMIYGPNDIFSLVWAITGKEHQYRYFEAMTPVNIRQCPRDAFRKFLVADSESTFLIFEQLVTRFDDLLQRITYMTVAENAQVKVYVFFVLLCQRFGQKRRKHLLPFPLTHKDVAGFLGLSRETVSIAVKKLLTQKALFYENHVFGVNLQKQVSMEQKELRDVLS